MPMRVKCNANYQNGRLATLQAQADGYDTAILLNSRGKVAEGPGMCLFMVRDGKAVTPPVTSDILESITRQSVMTLCLEYLGMEVIERDIDRSEFAAADEAFFCGTAWEVTPLVSVDRLPDWRRERSGRRCAGSRTCSSTSRPALATITPSGAPRSTAERRWTHGPNSDLDRTNRGRPRNRRGVEYEIFPCDPELADTAVFCERYGYPPLTVSANTILVKAKTGGERFVVCVVLANTRLDVNRTVRKRLGARRVSFASAHETRAVDRHGDRRGDSHRPARTSSKCGSMPASWQCEWVILGGGDRSHKIRVAPALFERIPGVRHRDRGACARRSGMSALPAACAFIVPLPVHTACEMRARGRRRLRSSPHGLRRRRPVRCSRLARREFVYVSAHRCAGIRVFTA